MPISLTSDTTITSNAAQTPERWSAEWLRTYLAESAQDPIAGVQALATELRALAEDDLPEALHRAQALRDIGTERWQFSRSVTSESCLTEVRNLARTFSITPRVTARSNATRTPERWSAEWLRKYLAKYPHEPLTALRILARQLRALAVEDLPTASRRADVLRDIGTERWQFSRSVTSESCLTEVRNLAATFSIELQRRNRPRLIEGVPNRIYLEERLSEIDRQAGLEATDGSAWSAFELFLRHGLVTREEYDVAKARSGDRWNYAGD
jgi:hypothetical protein